MHWKYLLFVAAVAVVPRISHAGPCGNVLAQDALIKCLGGEFQKADKQLNKVYGELRARLDSDAKEMLKKAQLAWLSYRDNDCEFQAAAAAGGQAQNPLFIDCQTKKTLHRTQELKESGW